MNTHRIVCLIMLAMSLLPHLSPGAETAAPLAETRDQRDARMKWWREAKFGMFIHWGVYAVPAGWYRDKPSNYYGEWLMHRCKIPMAEYQLYAKQFNPTKYNPEEWVKLAKDAGMKYMVITTKHHDGFAMFDTKASPFNIVQASPYGKDVIKELANACRKHGMKLGFYYSQAQDWNNGGATDFGNHTPDWDPAQKHDMDDYIDKVAVPQVEELLTNYGEFPAILWWDTPTNMTEERAKRLNDAVHALRPDIITNNRLGGGGSGDTETPEGFVPPQGYPGRDWETCMTMNNSWGYVRGDENWKTTQTIIRNLSDIVSKGGNYLLNVGPTAEGEIPAASIERLQAVAQWMKVNSDAIHGTQASPFPRIPAWGRCTTRPLPGGKTRLYLHVFDWPTDGRLVLSGLASRSLGASLLTKPAQALAFESDARGTVIQLPENMPDPLPTVVVLDVTGTPVIEPCAASAGADGVIALTAADATFNGHGLKLENKNGASYIGYWTNPADSVSFRVHFEKAGTQNVGIEWACPAATVGSKTEFRLFDKNNKQVASLPWTVTATGSWETFLTARVGGLDVPVSGDFTLRLVALDKPGEGVANVKSVQLAPAE